MTKISIIGSTGSIGRQALDVIDRYPDRFEVIALVAGRDEAALDEQVARYKPTFAALAAVDGHARYASGPATLVDAASHPEADLVLNAVVGSRGLEPTLAALAAGTRVALANKESLVAGGSLVTPLIADDPTMLLPVDSEHAALAQCVQASRRVDIERFWITASGGPFRGRTRASLEDVTVAEALAHPTWQMGRRISIDSATLFNKGLELIEACHLFGVTPDQVDAVVHPQSIVHGMVDFVDGSSLVQAATPDMRLPIAAALLFPDRLDVGVHRLDWANLGTLEFEPIDHDTFPAVRLALDAVRLGGTAPAIINAADEEAVAAFLVGRIGFLRIIDIVAETLEQCDVEAVTDLGTVLEAERRARETALALIDKA